MGVTTVVGGPVAILGSLTEVVPVARAYFGVTCWAANATLTWAIVVLGCQSAASSTSIAVAAAAHHPANQCQYPTHGSSFGGRHCQRRLPTSTRTESTIVSSIRRRVCVETRSHGRGSTATCADPHSQARRDYLSGRKVCSELKALILCAISMRPLIPCKPKELLQLREMAVRARCRHTAPARQSMAEVPRSCLAPDTGVYPPGNK
jgi:hypothetical protein